jgi:endoglucanase
MNPMILMRPNGKLFYPEVWTKLKGRATTAQASVNAIRAAGAKTQMIALPGTFWQHPEAYTDGRNDPILVSCLPSIIRKHKLIDLESH